VEITYNGQIVQLKSNEGILQSDPGGHECMGYEGGCAADYFDNEEEHEH
jgi:hypothetical protein